MAAEERRSPVAVVTGSTRGLGRGLAAALLRRGIDVMVSARDPDEAIRVATELRDAHPAARVAGTGCDVRDPAQLERLWDAAAAALGTPRIWVNNAGLALTGRNLIDTTAADLAAMIEINLLGTMNGCRLAAARMATEGGAIFNIHGAGSDGQPVPGMIGYGTTKRAVQFFTHALACELDPTRVTVCGLSPGLVMTEGFFREHARTPAEERAAREHVVNLIGDDVETVAEWACDIITERQQSGREFVWLTREKIDARRGATPPRDILARHRDRTGALPGGDDA